MANPVVGSGNHLVGALVAILLMPLPVSRQSLISLAVSDAAQKYAGLSHRIPSFPWGVSCLLFYG
jgi:hypothetical protein